MSARGCAPPPASSRPREHAEQALHRDLVGSTQGLGEHGHAQLLGHPPRLRERGGLSEPERKIFEALLSVKLDADEKVLNNSQILNNESYFERHMESCVITHFEDEHHITLTSSAVSDINRLIVAEYLNEFNTGARTW